mmetsp:Transcript_96741/g.260122  ORF Transcript_96741/g.260122 Transcript_96741/m.260122 type:complete len:96 (+) Transcript_96741:296-583(+)
MALQPLKLWCSSNAKSTSNQYPICHGAYACRGLRERVRGMPPGVMFGFASPQKLHMGLLPYTPLMWFLQDWFGHCQSPGRLVWEKVTAALPGLGA